MWHCRSRNAIELKIVYNENAPILSFGKVSPLIGDRFTDFLRNNNFDVVNIGNYIRFDMDETLVIDRIGNKANAYKVAEALGVKRENVIQQLNHDYFLDVSVVIGRDYYTLKPLKWGEFGFKSICKKNSRTSSK